MANPYELWNTHTLLAVLRDAKPETFYFDQFYTNTMLSTDEYIDLEKLPIHGRKLAPFVKPLGRGTSVYSDTQRTMRFKPAYVIVEETIDPLAGLSFVAGIDRTMLGTKTLSVTERRRLLKAAKAQQARQAVERTWEWMRAKGIIDGKVTVTYLDGTSALVDFGRAAGHTETLTSGNYWGDSGVSIFDHFQEVVDTMLAAEFGGMMVRATMPSAVAKIVRKDEEILKHMDLTVRGAAATVERGLVAGANGEKTYKFGELQVGGTSGSTIELWVNDETYDNNAGTATRYLDADSVVFTGTPNAIKGHECFGMIVDQDADYQALPIFPKNFTTGDDVKTEHMSFKSAPLPVPVNPNATYKAKVIAG